jgi:cysteine desulfurase/selenocysteine lyase
LAKSLKILSQIGMDKIAAHEAELTSYGLSKLKTVPGIKLYGDTNPAASAYRLGVITFNIGALPNGLVAAVLSAEWGIGVRNGCFCAHPYVMQLLGLNAGQIEDFRKSAHSGDRSDVPGMVRLSFGVYNTKDEIDVLVDALQQIAAGAYEGSYVQNKTTGEFYARGWQPKLANYFSL